jgi:FkbM family methyltransferase
MPYFRRGTYDSRIWSWVHHEYPTVPLSFAPGEVFIDVGCHTGAACELAAYRGATVVGYEANRENYWFALLNLRDFRSVTLHQAAIWRSDTGGGRPLLFTPSADTENTGGGSVMFSCSEDHWSARPSEEPEPPSGVGTLSSHSVDAIALDDVLTACGPTRVLKLDAEGSEFPILLTASRLDLVDAVVGEYHEFSDEAMAALAPDSVVGTERYTLDLLCRCLAAAGFEVQSIPDRHGRGFFAAARC